MPAATLSSPVLVAAFAWLLAWSSLATAQRQSVEEPVRAAYASFKSSIMKREGAEAARLVDDETTRYYERVRIAALTMSKAELLKNPLFFQIAVLGTRQYFTRADIEKITGRDLFGKNVDIGDPGATKTFEMVTLGQIKSEQNGLAAFADLEHEGKPTNLTLQFFLKDGRWRIDLMPFMKPAVAELERNIGITPRTPPAVIAEVLERDMFPALAAQTGRPVSQDVWLPMARRN